MPSGKRHYASRHQPNEPMACNVCNKMLKNRQARNQHLRQMHGVTTAMLKNAILQPSDTDLAGSDVKKESNSLDTDLVGHDVQSSPEYVKTRV